MFVVLLYTGRRYYISVLKRGLFLSTHDDTEPHAVWGMRVFIVASALFVIQLTVVGVDWYLAVLYTAATIMTFVVISRLVSEAGVFFVHSYLYPGIIALGLAQLITYIFDGEYRPRWLLRRADMVMYLYAVLVLLGSALHYIYITSVVSNYEWWLLSLSILLPAAAKCVIVIGLGRLLRSVLPMIEESRTLV